MITRPRLAQAPGGTPSEASRGRAAGGPPAGTRGAVMFQLPGGASVDAHFISALISATRIEQAWAGAGAEAAAEPRAPRREELLSIINVNL